MAESLPVVTVPGDEEQAAPEGIDAIAPQDIVVLHEVVVEELEGLEGEEEEEEEVDRVPFAVVVTEPSEPSDDVVLIGSSGEEEDVVEVVERVAGGPSRGGMSRDAGIHPVTVPSEMPIDDFPPDETMTALPAEETVVGDEDNRVVSEVTEKKVTVVEEVVTTVEEVVVATGEVVGRTVTDSVKVDEVLSVDETVSAKETEKGEKKRPREGEVDAADVKKLKSDEKAEGKEEEKVVEPKQLGPKLFTTPVEMFSYFYNLLHDWNLNQNVNKYEFLVLSELVSQGNPQKVGDGIAAFQVRMHPKWQSRCYYLIHKDGSEDDFSYRKCCDALMPLPASLYRKNGELDLEKLFPGQKGRHHREQNGGGRGGGRGDYRGGGRGGGGRFGGRGFGGGRGGRGGGGGRRGGRGKW